MVEKGRAGGEIMWCYVGKATKIFMFLVAVLLVVGLVLGFRTLRRQHSKDRGDGLDDHGCETNAAAAGCRPALPDQPLVPSTPTNSSSPPPHSPPSPVAAAQGPVTA